MSISDKIIQGANVIADFNKRMVLKGALGLIVARTKTKLDDRILQATINISAYLAENPDEIEAFAIRVEQIFGLLGFEGDPSPWPDGLYACNADDCDCILDLTLAGGTEEGDD